MLSRRLPYLHILFSIRLLILSAKKKLRSFSRIARFSLLSVMCFLFTSVLASCGGGAGTVGIASSDALYTTAPSSISIKLDKVSYTIGGGKPTYTISSSNSAVASVVINGNSFVITGVSAGSAQIIIFDANGASVNVAVTVGSGSTNTALYIAAASAITLPVNTNNHSYQIGGGTPTYSASSSNTAVATATVTGNTLVINALNAGTAQISVFDASGTSTNITVNVGASSSSPLYVTSASSVSLGIGDKDSFTIGGGSGSYSASSSNRSVATATVIANQITISALATGTSEILIFDSSGASVSVGVIVGKANSATISIQPENATGNIGDNLQFLVNGGTANYTITVNNSSIATVNPATVTTNSGSFTAKLLNLGATEITVTDASGQSKTFTLTVNQVSTSLRLSPNALTVGEDNTDVYSLNIFGGTAPYTAFTSDQTLTAVSTTGSLMKVGLGTNLNRCINPVDEGGVRIPNGTFNITLTVVDSLGASATSVLTIKDNGIGSGAVNAQVVPFIAPCQ